MREQWSGFLKPGRRVQVKIKNELVDAVIEKPCFVSKISFDCHYFYATAIKAEVKLAGTTSLRMSVQRTNIKFYDLGSYRYLYCCLHL